MRELTRRQAVALLGGGAALTVEAMTTGKRQPASWWASSSPDSPHYVQGISGYAPDGTAGEKAAYPLASVRLLDSDFRANQHRNLNYLLFVDLQRMLRSWRLNYGLPSLALPCGGWESPDSKVRGHTTGHILSGLALTYANTGSAGAKAAGEYLVGELAQLQAMAPEAGYTPGYLSAFPEVFFDYLENGEYRRVWSPYYMIHKYLAGLIDQYELAGVGQALEVATRLADWVDLRTVALPYEQMQQMLNIEFGGLPEALANLYSITGEERYLATAQRFYHAEFLDPLAAGIDNLAGNQCNVNTPKIIACVRMWEETGSTKYRDIAQNFWQMAALHHSYAIGGQGNHEHWLAPGVIASALSNYTCEGCVTYNMLKLTRLLHFHDLARTDLVDYYERGLFNQMLGTQDPRSAHGFNCYYTGLSAGAFKQQPLNYFPRGNPDVYSTDYEDFTCDNATGLETQAKFADTIYARDARGVYVNLFIPSEVDCADQGVTLRQTTGFPDDPVVRLAVTRGSAPMVLRVRVPSWTAGAPSVVLNGTVLRDAVLPSGSAAVATGAGAGASAGPAGGWVVVSRHWRPGDRLEVTLPMRLSFTATPDQPAVQAVSYGPVVLSGLYGASYVAADAAVDAANEAILKQSGSPGADSSSTAAGLPAAGGSPGVASVPDVGETDAPLPRLDVTSVRRTAAQPMTFEASADGQRVTMVPVSRAQHENFTVYWQTGRDDPDVTITGQPSAAGVPVSP